MKTLKRIWGEILRGENVENYIVILAAIIVVVLNLIGVNVESIIFQLILAILAASAISSVVNRHKLDQLLEGQTSDKGFIDSFPENMREVITSSSDVWFYGVSLNATIGEYYSVIENKLRNGDTFRILLVDPQSSSVEIAASRSYGIQDADRVRRRIIDTLQLLCNLREISENAMQIRVINNPLTIGATSHTSLSEIGTETERNR